MIDEELAVWARTAWPDHMHAYGVITPDYRVARELRNLARAYNQGRARKVSLRRPSARLSRSQIARLRVQARLNCVLRIDNER